ncbi:Flp family type IVb pilin [Pusillimonas sp.]|uniref:Flp family type IVb pilin n=1 Tax=Pusillimonas sp. TaxID=3040095 RepID=UPI0037C97C95
MLHLLMTLKRDERGISALEYAVLAALLLGLIVAGVQMLNPEALFQSAADAIDAAATATGG